MRAACIAGRVRAGERAGNERLRTGASLVSGPLARVTAASRRRVDRLLRVSVSPWQLLFVASWLRDFVVDAEAYL